MPPVRARPLLVLLAAAPLAAAEVAIADLRLVAEARPLDVTWRWEDRLGASTRDGALASAWAVGVGWRQGWGPAGRSWQVVGGIELLGLQAGADGFAERGLGLRAEGGAAWSPVHRLALTLLAGGGGGWRRATLDASAGGLALDGGAGEAGVRAGLRWMAARRWALGAEAGWLLARERLAGDGAVLRLDAAGGWLGASLAFVPDPLPAALDR